MGSVEIGGELFVNVHKSVFTCAIAMVFLW